MRRLVNFCWLFCGPAVIAFTVLLNIMVPIIGSMSELGAMMEPTTYNKTFYSKLEFPGNELKAALYTCIYGG